MFLWTLLLLDVMAVALIFYFSVDQSTKRQTGVNKTPFMAAPMCPQDSRRHPVFPRCSSRRNRQEHGELRETLQLTVPLEASHTQLILVYLKKATCEVRIVSQC